MEKFIILAAIAILIGVIFYFNRRINKEKNQGPKPTMGGGSYRPRDQKDPIRPNKNDEPAN